MSLKRKREDSDNRVEDLAHSYLTLQAYEARIRPAQEQRPVKLVDGTSGRNQTSGLIEWTLSGSSEIILVDRYDARLLLPEGFTPKKAPQKHSNSTNSKTEEGWDDLPSDSEDLFFFSREEAEDIRREKRRKTMESNRQARLAALKAEEDLIESGESGEHMNPSDEEPDPLQLSLMKKTATHIASSPNPLQFEMRILANHGSDKRFAFLRGRWKNAWNAVKQEVQTGRSSKPANNVAASGGLVTYDDSQDEESEAERQPDAQQSKVETLTNSEADDARIKAERRARVKEWSLKRKNMASIDNKENT